VKSLAFFIHLKAAKGTPFGQSVPVKAIIGTTIIGAAQPPPGCNMSCFSLTNGSSMEKTSRIGFVSETVQTYH